MGERSSIKLSRTTNDSKFLACSNPDKSRMPRSFACNLVKFFSTKDFDKSCDFFVKALGENFNSDTLNYLGRTLEELGNLNHAIIAFKQAVKIDPNHEYAETNLGFSLFKSGKLDEAMEIKAKLLSQNNVNSWCRKRLEEISIDTKTKTRKEDVTPNFLQFIE